MADTEEPAAEVTPGPASWPTGPTDIDRRELPPPPSRLGRYAVLRTLGSGGMGVVYAAYDEELERRVAIKVLHPRFSEDSLHRARILREAQAMAKVSHPNVAALHEVDAADRRLFVVMEFIDGPTLGGWLAAAPRSERDILEVYVQAERGLAAAHAAGLVHRDFKPKSQRSPPTRLCPADPRRSPENRRLEGIGIFSSRPFVPRRAPEVGKFGESALPRPPIDAKLHELPATGHAPDAGNAHKLPVAVVVRVDVAAHALPQGRHHAAVVPCLGGDLVNPCES